MILVSRSEEKLKTVKEQCKQLNPKVDIQIVPLDFSKAEPKDYASVFSRFTKDTSIEGGKNLRMLINNVGLND